jgi:hypothetical protein
MTLKRLHESIEQHDTKEVKQILQEFVDVNCIYCQETALTKAIRIREQDIVNAILEHQYCNVHAGNQFDRTPLYYAAFLMSFSLSVFNPHPVSCKQTENKKIYINITNILQSPKYHAKKLININ